MNNRVVITGIYPITSIGVGKEEFFSNLLNKKTNINPLPQDFDRGYRYKTSFYSPLPDLELESYGIKTHLKSILTYEDRMMLIGMKGALQDAGFSLRDKEGGSYEIRESSEWDIILGCGISGLREAFRSNLAHSLGRERTREEFGNRIKVNRMVIPMSMPSSIAAWGSIFYNTRGTAFTLNASCASGTYSIGEAFNRIKYGLSKRVITGGIEDMGDDFGSILRGFDMLGALTTSEDGLPTPFDEKRSGFLFSEGGGAIVILEELNEALKREKNIYAEIVDFKSSSDSYSIVQIEPEGEKIREMLRSIRDSYPIDVINTHGTGTQLNDKIELGVIDSLYNKRPVIQATKGLIGHTIGGSGAIEASVLAYTLKKGVSHGNIGGDIPQSITTGEFSYGLSTSFGFGGHNGALVLKSY